MEGEEAGEQIEDKHKLPHVIPRVPLATDDSGYSSDVFATPEVSRNGVKGPASFIHPCNTPDITNHSVSRLTSTPHSSASQEVFCPPIPKLEGLDVSQENPSNLATGTSFSSPYNALAVCELEVACLGSSNLPSRIPQSNKHSVPEPEKSSVRAVEPKLNVVCVETSVPRSKVAQSRRHSSPIKEQIKAFAERQKATLSRVITRRKTSQLVFMRMLQEADYLAIRVLQYLSGLDLLHLSHVNTQLRTLILTDKELSGRRAVYITRRRKEKEHNGKENYSNSKKCEGETKSPGSYGTLSPRKHLSAIQNLHPPSPTKAPAALTFQPSQSEKFIEEGRKLSKDEQLQKCPKCRSPARVNKGQQRAMCSCGYDYCTRCFLPFHPKPKECPVLKPRTRAGGGGIFSNKCKKSLRRL